MLEIILKWYFKVASKFTKAYNGLNNNNRNEKLNFCISKYKLLSRKITEEIEEQKVQHDFQRIKD